MSVQSARVAILVVLSAFTAFASQTPPASANQVEETHGDWKVVCAQKSGKKACVFSQQLTDKTSRQRVVGMELRPTAADKVEGPLVMPFGLAVDRPVTLQVDDGGMRLSLSFKTCVPIGCIVPLSLDRAAIDALKKGTVLNVKATAAETGQEAAFKLPLNGFGAALDRTAVLSK